MKPPLLPNPFQSRLFKILAGQIPPAYGQVATVDQRGNPKVRTVHFRYIKETNEISFATNIRSPKWIQLKKRPLLAACLYYEGSRPIQFRWEGRARLIADGAKNRRDTKILNYLWRLVRPDVRAAYWLDYNQSLEVEKRCPTFGAVLCRPTSWDIMEIEVEDYRQDRRSFHSLKKGKWESKRVSVVQGKEIYG